jgi:hypothetical protein
MTKAGRSTYAVTISLLLLLSLPPLTCAQPVTAYGSWNGYYTYSETSYDQFGNVTGTYSSGGPATLYVDFYGPLNTPFEDQAILFGPPGFDGQEIGVTSFGPTSATGFAFAGGRGSFEENFDVTYASILPGGQIDTTGGFAVADFLRDEDDALPGQIFTSFVSFNTANAPEPSAIVPMAIGALVVATSVVIRRRRAGKPLARAGAAGGLQ